MRPGARRVLVTTPPSLLQALSLLVLASSALAQEQSRIQVHVEEVAQDYTETSSASTRQEDLATHVKTEPADLTKHTVQDGTHTTKVNPARRYVGTQEAEYHSEGAWQHWAEKHGNSHNSVPQLELVVCRFNEKLEWLSRVPGFWQITVLNRGKPLKLPRAKKWNVVDLDYIHSDSQAFANYLVTKYDQLAEYTVFSPARPLQLNGRFMELLQAPTKLGTVQAMSGKPPGHGSTMFATDRISTRTLNSVLTHDPKSVEVAQWFSKDYNLTWGQNLAKSYFDMIGLHYWMDENQEIGSAALGGMIGFERSRATRHPKYVYEKLLASIPVFGSNMHVVERLWLMLFAGSDFLDVPT